MKINLFSKKYYHYLFLLLLLIFLIVIVYYNSNTFYESFSNSENNNTETTIYDDVSVDPSKTYSSSSNTKFQQISVIFQENRPPPYKDVNVNFVIKNNDGTLFNIKGDGNNIQTSSDIINENSLNNTDEINNTDNNSQNNIYNLIDNSTSQTIAKNNLLKEIQMKKKIIINFEITPKSIKESL